MLSLALRTISTLPSSSRHLRPRPHHRPSFRPFSVNMSTHTPPIEHVVLFKVKDGVDSSKVNDMLTGLNSLTSLEQVLHLTAAPVLRNCSSASNFTHLLHSRYPSKEDLSSYSAHSAHVDVVKQFVLPICDDIMAVDWVADALQGPVAAPPGSALRITFLKLKENLAQEVKNEILEVIAGLREKLGPNVQLTVGENFSPGRAKGYSIASIAIFPGPKELEAASSDPEMVELHKEKVREHLESVIVVDYVVPPAQTASL
ncbi:stress-response A/B barrel domain-containing protein UP3-like [Cucurbita maxima]|uniref:Stress-response A/B barrel domain-containing protein UP3-like n=1 Tax=Cucurbita maxima TaxID=3661 RepID=A0A6J1KGF6_CUCMA|nr:stress-response A/B barrel domain-containing protein UP3-like [Cucurbita maxima]